MPNPVTESLREPAEVRESRQQYDVKAHFAISALGMLEVKRAAYETSLDQSLEGGIVVESVTTDQYGNPAGFYKVARGDVFDRYLEEGKIDEPSSIFFVSMGPQSIPSLLGAFEHATVKVPKFSDVATGIQQPILYFVVNRELVSAPLGHVTWHQPLPAEQAAQV